MKIVLQILSNTRVFCIHHQSNIAIKILWIFPKALKNSLRDLKLSRLIVFSLKIFGNIQMLLERLSWVWQGSLTVTTNQPLLWLQPLRLHVCCLCRHVLYCTICFPYEIKLLKHVMQNAELSAGMSLQEVVEPQKHGVVFVVQVYILCLSLLGWKEGNRLKPVRKLTSCGRLYTTIEFRIFLIFSWVLPIF